MQSSDIRIPCQSIGEMHLMAKRLRYIKAHKQRIGEDEIRQRVELEIAFQARLAAAIDAEGYFVENVETPREREGASNRKEREREPDRVLHSWRCFRVYLKGAAVPFWLTVWLCSDRSTLPPGFSSSGWRDLGEDACNSNPSKTNEWQGVSFCRVMRPLCCHVLIIDSRLRFETLPLPAMRDALLGGSLAEELAAKVALAFNRISASGADTERGG